MSVAILQDQETGYKCMYCNTTMWAFGGIFYENEDPWDFIDWLPDDPRSIIDDRELETLISRWRLHNQEKEICDKLVDLGFVFPQGEFAMKGTWAVVMDCYPYLAESGRNSSIFFTTWDEFIKFYESEEKLNK